jgi:uncharacterized membrane-anchored protein YhcB (DUF1043 family)
MKEVTENSLQLVVENKTLGSLKTNATQIKEFVIGILPSYADSNYNDDNIDKAKKDKATLNKAAKALNSKRLELEKEFNAPFNEFKVIINDTISLMKDCSAKIDKIVKENEAASKASKKARIVDIFTSRNFNIVPLDKIFEEKWLNKGCKEKDIEKEIDNKIAKINSDLTTLNVLDNAELLKSMYLESLDLNSTIQYADTIKKNREKINDSKVVEPKIEQAQIAFTHIEPTQIDTPHIASPEIYIRAFKVTGTREDIIALGDFMNDRGMKFEKISV